MNYNDDYNPFADSSIRQATAAAPNYASQSAANDYNPFTNTGASAQYTPPPQFPDVAAVLPPVQPAAYQPPSYAEVKPTSFQQPADKYGSDTKQASTRVDLSSYERQQSEFEQREKRLAEREKPATDQTLIAKREKNFPPLPSICPCGPCFYQNIDIEIPAEFQRWVRLIYYLWLAYSITLFLNLIAGLSYFVVDKEGGATFGLSLVYFFLFVPASYVCWFRPIYRAFRNDSAANFMIFFMVFFIQIIITALQAFGIANLGCGFVLMIKLFSTGGRHIAVGLLSMIVTFSFAIITVADGLLMIKVHRLYRQSGASLEQAQREFQTAFVNNPTVRGAAREVATAGINEAVQGGLNQQRPIY